MTLSTAPFETDIQNRVLTVNPRVFVSEIPDAIPTPAMPYVVIYFGDPIRASGDHHMVSTRNDTNIGYCTVRVTSSTDTSARDVNDLIRDALVGFRPTDCGEMSLGGRMAYSNGSNDVKPTKYYRETGYSYRTNLQWS